MGKIILAVVLIADLMLLLGYCKMNDRFHRVPPITRTIVTR
jgi:hypothetical protein